MVVGGGGEKNYAGEMSWHVARNGFREHVAAKTGCREPVVAKIYLSLSHCRDSQGLNFVALSLVAKA